MEKKPAGMEMKTSKRLRRRGDKTKTAATQDSEKRRHISDTTDSARKDGHHRHHVQRMDAKGSGRNPSILEPLAATRPSNEKRKRRAPKLGEEGYLTATQLRNARKRRSKKQITLTCWNDKTVENDDNNGNDVNNSADNERSGKVINYKKYLDPSLRYIHNPRSAPIVRNAINYFQSIIAASNNNKTTTMMKQLQIHSGPTKHWRTVSKLPVRRNVHNNNSVVIGMFQPSSHDIVSVSDCVAHHPSINSAILATELACNTLHVEPYNETTGQGQLRYITINVERCTGKVQLTLIWNSHPPSPKQKHNNNNNKSTVLDQLLQELIAIGTNNHHHDDELMSQSLSKMNNVFRLHSLWVHYNAQNKHANNMFDHEEKEENKNVWHHVYGPPYIIETLDLSSSSQQTEQVPLYFPPNVFRQANLDAFTDIVSEIRKSIYRYNDQKKGDNVLSSCLELYGGVGTIGLNVCDLTSRLVCSDSNPYNAKCFQNSVDCLQQQQQRKQLNNKQQNIVYRTRNATDMIQQEHALDDDVDIVIVDPPRKGLEYVVINALISSNKKDGGPQLLIYVSCGFDAFQRDCDILLASKCWILENAIGYLLFPGSDAIEILAFFIRPN